MKHVRRLLLAIIYITIFLMILTIGGSQSDKFTFLQPLFRGMVESIVLMIAFMGYKVLGGEWN